MPCDDCLPLVHRLTAVERQLAHARSLAQLDEEHNAWRRALLRERYPLTTLKAPVPIESPSLGAQRLAEITDVMGDEE